MEDAIKEARKGEFMRENKSWLLTEKYESAFETNKQETKNRQKFGSFADF